jgi:virulence-associated protein VagC
MRARVTEEGVLIPKRLLPDIEEVEIRREGDLIIIIPLANADPIFNLGFNPVRCNAGNASENLDEYLYDFRCLNSER